MVTLSDLRQHPHVSVSQLKMFVQCPRKYSYQYIERQMPEFRSIALAFGSAWHEAIDSYLVHGTDTNETTAVFRDALAREVRADDVPVLFDDDEDLGGCIDQGARMLDTFIGRVPRPDLVLGVELAFSIELVDPDTGEQLPAPLIGAIDALVVENDTPEIWELKTGKRKWGADQLEFDPQPTAYQMGARVFDIEAPELKLLLTSKGRKPDVQVERLVRNKKQEDELALLAASVQRAIEAGVDHRLRGWQCKTCQYAGRCG
ncbi:MAG TPA: PD-(D/E)XK nuclease family protein [Polyangiaceae bacterium]|nr:PD-(D/E)XK nuclease family protein [Polyangiaceae bacterium]